jgi:hypothetical protein
MSHCTSPWVQGTARTLPQGMQGMPWVQGISQPGIWVVGKVGIRRSCMACCKWKYRVGIWAQTSSKRTWTYQEVVGIPSSAYTWTYQALGGKEELWLSIPICLDLVQGTLGTVGMWGAQV